MKKVDVTNKYTQNISQVISAANKESTDINLILINIFAIEKWKQNFWKSCFSMCERQYKLIKNIRSSIDTESDDFKNFGIHT